MPGLRGKPPSIPSAAASSTNFWPGWAAHQSTACWIFRSHSFFTFSVSGCPSTVIIGTFSFHFSSRTSSSISMRSA